VKKYILSKSAEADLISIFEYTFENWGASQLDAYRQEINNALHHICQNPQSPLSKPRDDLAAGCRLYRVSHHMIAYRLINDDIQIARILHKRMNIEQQVSRKTFQ